MTRADFEPGGKYYDVRLVLEEQVQKLGFVALLEIDSAGPYVNVFQEMGTKVLPLGSIHFGKMGLEYEFDTRMHRFPLDLNDAFVLYELLTNAQELMLPFELLNVTRENFEYTATLQFLTNTFLVSKGKLSGTHFIEVVDIGEEDGTGYLELKAEKFSSSVNRRIFVK